ncbi:Aryl-alcohol dehydrogenase [NADP(+)] [Sparassis crispa]|uniref:Aryl-alcohol dehydrogenase [NADP(+)] n=1 Tax=Sparassis crispa TaxID=139825 RepID=A0A401H695_9APHY|nr:Aryl-alcohol dehydrogenase [NADP(+)] [Sparassis crispa]GBE89944.1 Aryl-alcohol dehydrogenase [NADP(+)] [Sparassis crispa]
MANFWAPPSEPPTRLGRHRQLSPLAGVHVSPFCLGGLTIGDQWGQFGMGETSKEGSFKLLDAFYEAGGNFIDTGNSYQDETSEKFIGEWMEKRGNRDQMVIATKYTTNFKRAENLPQKTSYLGNNVKSMHISVEASLKKLRTSYIDILYVHWWDFNTSVEEVMNGLHYLVVRGLVLYLGISDTPAWVVAKANTYARTSGKTPFVIYQGGWSILQRDFEREIIPMARSEGLALAPFGVMGAGRIRTDVEEQKRRETGENGRTFASNEWERTPEQRKVCQALEEVASQVGAKSITSVAIAYVMQKAPYVFPLIGARKVEQLKENIEALSIALSAEQIVYLENIIPFQAGFPHGMVGDGTKNSNVFNMAGHFDRVPVQQAIRPTK